MAFTSTGTLRPDHTIGSSAVKILCYRYESGKWRLKKTVTATMATAGKYSASVKLPTSGKWRLYASHSDTDHALSKSVYRARSEVERREIREAGLRPDTVGALSAPACGPSTPHSSRSDGSEPSAAASDAAPVGSSHPGTARTVRPRAR